jgi:hypothetical protein
VEPPPHWPGHQPPGPAAAAQDLTVTVISPSGSVTLDARRVDDSSVLPLLREVLWDHDEH